MLVARRWRATAMATRDVSMVIQRRPHFSDMAAVVPEPQVGSRTRSPGSVVIRMQRSMTLRRCFYDVLRCLVRSLHRPILLLGFVLGVHFEESAIGWQILQSIVFP